MWWWSDRVKVAIRAHKTDFKKWQQSSEDEDTGSYGLGYRHIQALLMFLTLAFGFIASGHAGVTIVAMSNPDNNTADTVTRRLNWKFELTETHDIVRHLDIYQLYDWPKSVHEIILGAFFLGVAVMMFPIGLLGQRFGGKLLLQISLFLNAVTSLVAPWLIAWGDWISFAVIRFLQGGALAGLYPGIQFTVTHWFPISERNSLSSYIYAGTGIGSTFAFLLAGILAESELGYPGMFWLVGILCSIAFFLLTFLGSATPNEHRFVSEKEKKYIVHDHVEEVVTNTKVPWKNILTSIPLWATVIAHVGNSVAFVFIFNQVPSYMVGVLNFDIMASGILTALPYLGSCISALAFGNLSDYLTNRKIISMKMARIIFNSIACFIPAICLIIVTFTNNSILAVVCFVILSTANSGHHFGWMVNYIDLSPNYCGTLMAIGNTLTNIFAVVLPIIISFVVTDMTNRYQWRVLLLLMAGCTFVSNVIFIMFMSADIQPWNKLDEEEEEDAAKQA
ncbi:putative inorganic phosphate cotransporter [Melitaea cinxia]|uniref:putative inorganic phosphate cotransporter n=1 Tax=Melitaea cinxia TaxID=113334 RepID=UPI001E2747F0|nr:putative inorganic phosphate cotransporter [Melitaea cinxia]